MNHDNRSIFNVIPGIIGIIIFVFLISSIIYIIHDDLTTIDTRVETVDGKIYDCTDVTSNDGMTYIRKPYYITMPTRNIKIIKQIN